MSEAAMFRLSESLHGSVLKTNDAEPRVLLKFVKRAAGRKVLTLDVELLARLLETKPDQREVVRIPGEVCVTPVMPKGKKAFGNIRWTRIDIVGECTAHDVFPLTRMEFLQMQHHLELMRATVARYAEGLRRSREPQAVDTPAVLREGDTEAAQTLRRDEKRKNVAHDETGPPCELLILEPMPPTHELTSREAPVPPVAATQPPVTTAQPPVTTAQPPNSEAEMESESESESESDFDVEANIWSSSESESLLPKETQAQAAPRAQDIPQTLELLD